MAERRSLGEALTLTQEKVQFIKGDNSDAFAGSGNTAAIRNVAPTQQNTNAQSGQQIAPAQSQPAYQQPRMETYAPTLASVTTRLQQSTAAALRRAYLEQKLNRQFPDTQQEIIEEALQHWLYEKGFLK